jgi:hypothetical protein
MTTETRTIIKTDACDRIVPTLVLEEIVYNGTRQKKKFLKTNIPLMQRYLAYMNKRVDNIEDEMEKFVRRSKEETMFVGMPMRKTSIIKKCYYLLEEESKALSVANPFLSIMNSYYKYKGSKEGMIRSDITLFFLHYIADCNLAFCCDYITDTKGIIASYVCRIREYFSNRLASLSAEVDIEMSSSGSLESIFSYLYTQTVNLALFLEEKVMKTMDFVLSLVFSGSMNDVHSYVARSMNHLRIMTAINQTNYCMAAVAYEKLMNRDDKEIAESIKEMICRSKELLERMDSKAREKGIGYKIRQESKEQEDELEKALKTIDICNRLFYFIY